MIFAEQDEGHLKAWIVKRLADTSDADSDVLADYVLALLRHDSDQATIRNLFESEIPDFLGDESTAFTNDVFQAINYKSYLPGAPPAPPLDRQPHSFGAPTAAPFVPQVQKQNAPNPRQSAPSQKRKVGDREDDEVDIILDDAPTRSGAPAQKLQKTGRESWQNGPLGNGPSISRNGSFGQQQYGNLASFGQGNAFDSNGQGFPAIDPAIILQNIQMLQQMGIPLPDPSALGMSGSQKSRKKRKRCKDYDKKGFCARGHKCKFEHGAGSVFLPSFISPPSGDVMLNYDPSDPSMAMAAMFQPPTDAQFGQQHDRNATGKSQKFKKQKGSLM